MSAYEEHIETLWNDYLDLCEQYEHKLPVHEFGFAIIRFASKMLFDMAPNDQVAFDTINVAMQEGCKWSREDKEND